MPVRGARHSSTSRTPSPPCNHNHSPTFHLRRLYSPSRRQRPPQWPMARPHPPSHIHALPPALVLDINGWTDGWMFGPPCPPPLAAAARTHICTHVKPASSHLARSRRPQTCAVLASCRSRQSRSLSPPSPACQKRNPETRPTLQPLDAASHQHLHLGKRYLCSTAHAHVRHVRV